MSLYTEFFPEVPLGSDGGALYRVHRKKGHPFALLPDGLRHQWELAGLLPGQSFAARCYRQAVRALGMAGLTFPKETISLSLASSNPLVAFVQKHGGSGVPPVLLPGNPHGVAPRLVLIALTDAGNPAAVVKAGRTPPARELIRREADVLQSLPALPGIPKVMGSLDAREGAAFAMEFADGNSPCWPTNPEKLGRVLTAWIDPSQRVTIGELPIWKSFLVALDGGRLPRPAWLHQLAGLSIHPCLSHGDFAPWNVREDKLGQWTVIDWERGEAVGIPGWDWLHFVLQPAILVKKWDVRRVREIAEATIRSPEFLHYLGTAFPEGLPPGTPQALLRGYFLYNWSVLQPTEGRAIQEVLSEWVP